SDILMKRLEEAQMDRLFMEIEMPLVFTLFDMEQNGVKINSGALKEYGDQLAVHISMLEQEIYDEAGETFNITSPKQPGVIRVENLKCPCGITPKTGYSTATDVLEQLAPDYPVIATVLEYRQYAKPKSTYADGLANFIADDRRTHGTFNQPITATGRISST